MTAGPVSIRNYGLVTLAYWAFTLTDGALRMLVLLHFHGLGYAPLQLALLFVLYEALGAVTNLFGGVLATRFGLKATLVAGLALQVGALLMLSGLSMAWSAAGQVAYVVAAQGLSGVAKDLTKLSAKSAVKFVVPKDAHGALFRWVALLTGSKNALKGVGFFVGGALLTALGFQRALWSMAAVVGAVAISSAAALPGELGRAGPRRPLARLFAKSRAINLLSGARVFLFGARDVWFVVALPVFLSESLGWAFTEVGGFMAAWVIGYGGVQALAPKLLRHRPGRSEARAAGVWAFALAMSALGIAGALRLPVPTVVAVLGGLTVFGVLFAVNSSLHSYLILAYAESGKVAADVGFYYMSNAIGRLLGTVLSGAMYQAGGLGACLLTAGVMLLGAAVLGLRLPDTPT